MGTKRSLAPFPSDPAAGVTPRSATPSSCLRAKLSALVTLCSSAQLLLQEPLAFYSHGWTRPAPPQQHWSCSVPWGSPKRVVILGPEVPMSVLPPRQPAVGLEVGTGACAAPLGITVAICSRDPSRKLSLGWPPAPHGVTPCPTTCSPWRRAHGTRQRLHVGAGGCCWELARSLRLGAVFTDAHHGQIKQRLCHLPFCHALKPSLCFPGSPMGIPGSWISAWMASATAAGSVVPFVLRVKEFKPRNCGSTGEERTVSG